MTKIINNEAPPKILMKNNVLVQAKYNLSLVENRVFLLLLYKLQKTPNGVLSCEITHDEFKEIIKKTKDRSIGSIEDILSGLRRKPIYFIKEKNNGDVSWGEYGFINGFEYDVKSKIFHIESSEKIYSLIQNYLESGYTPNNLAVLFGLGNYYAQRLYDLLRLWSGTKSVITYSVDELKMYLSLEGKYGDYNTFKRRVILPAIKALVDIGCFEIDFKENKVGRKVDSIDFIVKDLDKRKYFTKEDVVTKIPGEVIEEVAVTAEGVIDNKEETIFKPKFSAANEIINESKECDFEPFVPDETLFTKGTLRSFKIDFKGIDFKNKYMEKAFNDSVMVVLDRDDVETIKATSYKFFKGTLDNKIVEYKIEEKEDIEHQKNIEMFW
ncbi:replication initiation protein [Clostridium sp.]|uniref:replication initiation protein n=1 Tax=Clostridium sp. TaxID=1506 RepID=UPI003F37D4A9